MIANNQPIQQWFNSDIGQMLLAEEQRLLTPILSQLFGYHFLQMSAFAEQDLFQGSKIRHSFCMAEQPTKSVVALCDEQLPIANESLDVVLLHHLLESTASPHLLLRDAARAIVPSGHLVIVGFNPWGPAALLKLTQLFGQPTVWEKPFYSVRRLKDWLAIMDFSVQTVQYGFYRLPVTGCLNKALPLGQSLLQKRQWPVGTIYIMVAQKQQSRITPIHLPNKIKKRAVALEPTLYQKPSKQHECDRK